MFGGKRLLVYELNEVPLKVFAWYASTHRDSAIARLLSTAYVTETRAADEGHLSPWVTWPTLHRGVTSEHHRILDLGQDLRATNEAFPPIWELLSRADRNVGVFGSLHSYPLPTSLRNFSFLVPDTFASGPECFPDALQAFQRFNLAMVDQSGRNVSGRLPFKEAATFLGAAPGLGLRAKTLFKLASQVIGERFNRNRTVRRRTSQIQLAFDFFLNSLIKARPEFATFFTNHVASSMHRYWPATFPEDYDSSAFEASWLATWKHEIPFAMQVADDQLADLMDFVGRDRRYALLVLTSMGQAALRQQGSVKTELLFDNLVPFMSLLGFATGEWTHQRAMAPQYMVRVGMHRIDELHDKLSKFSIAGKPLSFAHRGEGTFRIELGHNNIPEQSVCASYMGSKIPCANLGMTNVLIQDEAGSNAYHVPEGTMIVYGTDADLPNGRQLSTLEIAPAILRNFSVRPPNYMLDIGGV